MTTLTARALNIVLDSAVPDWIQLLPSGPQIQGADGRAWKLPDPNTLIAAFRARNKPMVVDWEHASENRAPQGLDAPASGWIDQFENRNGAIWGHVEWTPKAAQQIAAKEYRFLSPVFTYQKTDAQIIELVSAGLTNKPNLNLTALNREQPMDLTPLCAALGIAAGSDVPALTAAVSALKAENAKAMNRADAPSLEKFIPRADYDATLARATNAEQKLAEIDKASKEQAITTLIESALTARKITPATKDFYVGVCRSEGGIEQFKAFLEKVPPVIGESPVGDKPIPASDPKIAFAANAELRAEFGDVETYEAWLTAEKSGRVSRMGVTK